MINDLQKKLRHMAYRKNSTTRQIIDKLKKIKSVKSHELWGLISINTGSLFSQIVQVGGYPALLALLLSSAQKPGWLIGLIISLQWAVVLFMAPLVPRIIARVSILKAVQISNIITMFSLFLLMATGNFAMALSSVLMGVGLTIQWVICDIWIVSAAEPGTQGRVIGVHETLMGLGIALGPLYLILGNSNKFIIISCYIITIMTASIVFFLAPIIKYINQDDQYSQKLFHMGRILILAIIAAVVAGYIETSMVSLFPLHLMSFGYTENTSFVFMIIYGMGGTVLQPVVGWSADKWGFRRSQFFCACIMFGGTLFLIFGISQTFVIIPALFLFGSCVGGLNTLAVIEAGTRLQGAAIGAGISLVASCYTGGSIIGPIISASAKNTLNNQGALIIITVISGVYLLFLLAPSIKMKILPPK